MFLILGISFLDFNQNNRKEGPNLHQNEVLVIYYGRKKKYI